MASHVRKRSKRPAPRRRTQSRGKAGAGIPAAANFSEISLQELFPPKLQDRWENEAAEVQASNITSARDAYIRRGLVLYLGAGVSCSVGLPTWWNLIQSLTVSMMTEQVDEALIALRKLTPERIAQAKLRNHELNAIAAAVLGGTSMSGGRGTIGGTIIGAFVIGILSDGLVMMGVSSFWQMVIKGLVIIVAVVVDQAQRRLQQRVTLMQMAKAG